MKIRLTFKDPDGVYESIKDAAREKRLKIIREAAGAELDEEEADEADLGNLDIPSIEDVREEISESLRKWIEYGEYCTVEIDLEAGTATVVEV